MMIDSVVWAQYSNVTDTQTDRHVAVANTAPTHCVGRQKNGLSLKVHSDDDATRADLGHNPLADGGHPLFPGDRQYSMDRLAQVPVRANARLG